MFDSFFEKFGFRLQLEHGISEVSELIAGTTSVYDIDDYCDTLVRC